MLNPVKGTVFFIIKKTDFYQRTFFFMNEYILKVFNFKAREKGNEIISKEFFLSQLMHSTKIS